jgi:hypothetical protein
LHRVRRNLRSFAWWRAGCALWITLALGCAAVHHAMEVGEYAGQPLSPSSGRGAQRFASELQIDKTLAAYVAEHGRPDYYYIVDRQKLYFFYVDTDAAAMFERILIEGSQVTELGRIPGSLLKLLPPETVRQVAARRAEEQRRAQAKVRSGHRRAARSDKKSRAAGPAAVAPGGSYIGGFETPSIVARMRDPLTAADPGVRSWKEQRSTGGAVFSAQVGRTRYEVADDHVAFTVSVSASRGHLPDSARLAIQRVNAAIFAAKADGVTRKMIQLAERSVADRTGRTSFALRMEGRTIRMGRRLDAGVFAYSVHP